MKRNRRMGTPWRRKNGSADARALAELQARRFNTLDDCERVWTEWCDPLALMVAITKSNLPRWLEGAVLTVLYSGGALCGAKKWKARDRDDRLARQAVAMLSAREHPERPVTREIAGRLGAAPRAEPAQADAIERAGATLERDFYRRVLPGLRRPARFYRPPDDFYRRVADAIRGSLDTFTRSQESLQRRLASAEAEMEQQLDAAATPRASRTRRRPK